MTPSFMSLGRMYKFNMYGYGYVCKDMNREMEQCCRIKGKDCFLIFFFLLECEQKLLKGGRKTGGKDVH